MKKNETSIESYSSKQTCDQRNDDTDDDAEQTAERGDESVGDTVQAHERYGAGERRFLITKKTTVKCFHND